jgi:geranylgeranyl pyrophosphate synthase
MTNGRPKAVLSDPRLEGLPAELRTDVERYLDQGGLLGTVTYTLVYLDSGDERAAARAASIPTNLFVASCLHDDAIDLADGRGTDRKSFRNWRVTVGDVVYTRILDAVDALGADFETGTVTDQFRAIAYGQLREETVPGTDPSMAEAVTRVEERGSVWGELAVCPAVAGGYGGAELEHVSTVVENVLFVLTLVDDVEDVPEDVENGVANLPVLLADSDPADYDSTAAFVDALVASDLPRRLDAVVDDHEAEMAAHAHRFAEASEYTPLEIVEALDRALEWYREAACTVPLDETVPPARRSAIRERLADDDEREAVMAELLAAFPLSVRSPDEVVTTGTHLPTATLAPAVVGLFHVFALVDGVMTTDLDAALDALREGAAAAD